MKKGSKKAAESDCFTIIPTILSDKDLLRASEKPPSLSEAEFLLFWWGLMPLPT